MHTRIGVGDTAQSTAAALPTREAPGPSEAKDPSGHFSGASQCGVRKRDVSSAPSAEFGGKSTAQRAGRLDFHSETWKRVPSCSAGHQ